MEIRSGTVRLPKGAVTVDGKEVSEASIITLSIDDICQILHGESVVQLVCDSDGRVLFQHVVTAGKIPVGLV